MDDRGWYMWGYKAINTPDETIKRLKQEEMGTSESNLLMWEKYPIYARFIREIQQYQALTPQFP